MNPLLSREVRARWRDGRSFLLVFAFAAGLSLLFTLTYGSNAEVPGKTAAPGSWALLGQSLFSNLAWIQTLAWLLIAPSLTSSAISYERERGWFDSLILSRLLPRQIALGKWSGALLYAALLYGVSLPCVTLILLLGGVSPLQLALVLMLHALCAACGAAVGLASSAWSYRSHVALRSANGLLLIWLIGSFIGATWTGRGTLAMVARGWGSVPTFWELLGRTNPLLCAGEISSGSPTQNWPFCFSVLALSTLFFLWVASYYANRPLEEAPYIEPRVRKKDAPPLQSHGEIPLVTKLKFANPVLDHEVRSKFRMRQPPLVVIIVEALLGLLVAGFYLRTLHWAWFEPRYRINIWSGLVFTGMIVTMMSAAVMGSNGFSREREKGTWESLKLSLLGPGEIIRGKIFGSLTTCALFSLPVLPLLIPCVAWTSNSYKLGMIEPIDALCGALIWLATIWSFTLVGLWIGRKQSRSSRAAGQTLGLLAAFVILGPIAISWFNVGPVSAPIITTLHPLAAILNVVLSQGNIPFQFARSGPSYVLVHFALGLLIWAALTHALRRELGQEEAAPPA
jgi:ABC-type transport system involved in multi-copper enzyme maturation permease subunit